MFIIDGLSSVKGANTKFLFIMNKDDDIKQAAGMPRRPLASLKYLLIKNSLKNPH
jgi:hypothetical protein